MSTKVKTTNSKVMKYKELITRTESEINKELLDLEVANATDVKESYNFLVGLAEELF